MLSLIFNHSQEFEILEHNLCNLQPFFLERCLTNAFSFLDQVMPH